MNIIKILKELKPIYYKDLPKITLEDVEKLYNREYVKLIEVLNKIKKDKTK